MAYGEELTFNDGRYREQFCTAFPMDAVPANRMMHMAFQAARLNDLPFCDSQADLEVTMGVAAQEKTEMVSELHRCP